MKNLVNQTRDRSHACAQVGTFFRLDAENEAATRASKKFSHVRAMV